MDMAVHLYLAVPLLFTILALVLASIFMRMLGAEREQPREPVAADTARERGPGDQAAAGAGPEAGMERLPVEKVGAVKEGKDKAAEQWEEVVEEPSPVAESSPTEADSIPQQPAAEPCEHEPQEDAETKIPPLEASAGSSLGHPGQVEDAGDPTEFPNKAEVEYLDSEKEKLVVREPVIAKYMDSGITCTLIIVDDINPSGVVDTLEERVVFQRDLDRLESCSEPCVARCADSTVFIEASPVVVTLPGPILTSFPQSTAVGSSLSAASELLKLADHPLWSQKKDVHPV
ncbi:LOW QUALITY PROTEIN: uncharacterized protein LOC136019155 [Lathamus discolor]|uniref:LOW QUALITY PROTEIN: uncharacterized protein LOC136019155 n=1 Tax=Lathamus discolor TaxID=678569 RepID=UPI0032B85D6B